MNYSLRNFEFLCSELLLKSRYLKGYFLFGLSFFNSLHLSVIRGIFLVFFYLIFVIYPQ
jgi:hypothetical protein